MKILLAFDTDGTFWTDEEKSEYICGMIDPRELDSKLMKNNYVDVLLMRAVVVSESPYYPKTLGGEPLFELCNTFGNRFYNLLKAKEAFTKKYGAPDICIYVDDLDIWRKDAHNAGFAFINAEKFADMFGVRHET